MSAGAVAKPRMLCLGEALVDLVGEEPVRSMRQVQRFAPHLGGTVANVAVVAARAGAPVSLAGAAGDDEWGRWLSAKLVDEGVDVALFRLLAGVQTQLAFTAIDPAGEPTYELYGEPAETIGAAVAGRLEQAVAAAAGVLISSNTLAGPDERAVTMRARELALSLGRPVVFDCNLRLHRWASRDEAAASANGCVPGALLVRANQAEAEVMTGEPDAERAAAALRAAGATLVVITLGAGGAILRGAEQAAIAAAPAEVVSTMGAGDAFTGTLLAALIHSDFRLAAVAAALGDAAHAAARACEHWGSLD